MTTFKLCLKGRADAGAEEVVILLQGLIRRMRKLGLEITVSELVAKPDHPADSQKVRKVDCRSAPGWTMERQVEATAALLAFVNGKHTSPAIHTMTGIHRSTLVHLLRGAKVAGRETIRKIVDQLMAINARPELIEKFRVMLTAPPQ